MFRMGKYILNLNLKCKNMQTPELRLFFKKQNPCSGNTIVQAVHTFDYLALKWVKAALQTP